MCTVKIVCDFVCLEWDFDLAFNMGLEMRWSLWWQFVEESWVLEQISVRKAKTCWVFYLNFFYSCRKWEGEKSLINRSRKRE